MPGCLLRLRYAQVSADSADLDDLPDWVPHAGQTGSLKPSVGGLVVYDPQGAKIVVELGTVKVEVDADGWLCKRPADGGDLIPLRVAPTDDPLMSVTGWRWTLTLGSRTIGPFPAPASGVVELADYVTAPAVDATKTWVERIPELVELLSGATVATAVADYLTANPLPGTIPDSPVLVAPTLVAATPAPTYGPELAPPIATWTGAAGATWTAPSWNIPSGGTISAPIAVVSGTMYQIEMTRTGSSGGLMTAALGTATTDIPSDGNSKLTLTAAETGTVTLTIGGGTWACASISNVTVKAVTALASARTTGVTMRALSSNSAVGGYSQYSLTTGDFNSAVGGNAQRVLTTGSYNSAVGGYSQYSLTTGSYNIAVGGTAQYILTTGSYNSAVGRNAQRALTTGSYNSALGGNAGFTDNITATVATVNYATMLGYNAQATVSNVCVIGSALSSERQTLCLGNYDALGSNVRGGFALSNAQTVPTTNPTGGGILYAEGGALKWRGSAGTITTIAAA